MENSQPGDNWGEDEYLSYLDAERRLFAWCLVRFGRYSQVDAAKRANARYPYESSQEPYRWVMFHNLAWDWAMLELYGSGYWRSSPELAQPSDQYREKSDRLHSAR
jgi:hypothetical protein